MKTQFNASVDSSLGLVSYVEGTKSIEFVPSII